MDETSTIVMQPALAAQPDRLPRTQLKLTSWDLSVALLPLLGMLPMLVLQGVSIWERPHLRFVPLVLLIVGGLSVRQLFGPPCKHHRRLWLAIGCGVVSMTVYAVAVWAYSPWLAHAAAVGLFFSWALGRWGKASWTHVGAVTLLLASTLPWPENLDVQADAWLKSTAGSYASAALDAFNVPHLLTSGQLRTESMRFALDDLSSYGSVFALFAVSGLLGVFGHRGLLHVGLLLVSAPVWYGVCASLGLLAGISMEWELNAYLQLALFAASVTCLLLLDQFLALMLLPVPVTDPDFEQQFALTNKLLCWPQPDPMEDVPPEDPAERELFEAIKAAEAQRAVVPETAWQEMPHATWPVWTAAVGSCLLGIAPAIVIARGEALPRPVDFRQVDDDQLAGMWATNSWSTDGLPKRLGGWTEIAFRAVPSTETQAAHLEWRYVWRGQTVAVSLAFPFHTWRGRVEISDHREWRKEMETVINQPNGEWNMVLAQFINPLEGKSYVLQTALDDSLEPVITAAADDRKERRERARAPIVRMLSSSGQENPASVYRITAHCESGGGLSPAELGEFHQSFEAFCRAIRDQLEPGKLASLDGA